MRALVTGIKPYTMRLSPQWADRTAPHFDGFERIQTKKEVIDATCFNGNTGNYLIGEGAIEAIGRNKATFVNFGFLHAKTKESSYLAEINSQFDCFVLVTANLLRSDYNAQSEAELISRIGLPVIILGIGCQRIRDLPTNLPEGTLRFIDALKSKEHHIFTRGVPTAEFLRAQGLRNVWESGCPSIFVRPHNFANALQKLKSVDWNSSMRIAFSGYLGRDRESIRDIQAFANRERACSYILQDEHLSWGLEINARDNEKIYNDMSGELQKPGFFPGSEEIPDIRLRLFFNTHQWRAVMSMHDVAFGRRFHGIIAALQAGIPGLMIANDDRMREMIDQLQLPYIDVEDWNREANKLALLHRTVAEFDIDQWCDRYTKATNLFKKRMISLGFGSEEEISEEAVDAWDNDLAFRKPAFSSSVSPWSRFPDPERDASGANGESFASDYGFHTQREPEPWWMVDLLEEHIVEEVAIVNRPRESHRFQTFRIETSLDGNQWTTQFSQTEPAEVSSNPASPWRTLFNEAPAARYVRIVLLGHGPLHLRRVQVFGRNPKI
jgi:hypothetical protein